MYIKVRNANINELIILDVNRIYRADPAYFSNIKDPITRILYIEPDGTSTTPIYIKESIEELYNKMYTY